MLWTCYDSVIFNDLINAIHFIRDFLEQRRMTEAVEKTVIAAKSDDPQPDPPPHAPIPTLTPPPIAVDRP